MTSMLRRLSVVALAVAIFSPGKAEANAVPVGSTISVIVATLTIGTAVGYDSTNHVYLVLGCNGSQLGGFVIGRFTDPNGNPLGSPFAVPTTAQHYMFLPSLAFSADANGGAGGFLVAWHESDLPGSNNSVHARMVAWGQGGPYGTENVVNTDGTYQAEQIGMAYSTANKEFLLTFEHAPGAGGYGVRAFRVDNNANLIAPSFAIAQNGHFEQGPSVAYNPVTNQFLVSYVGWAGSGFVASRLVQSGTSQLIGAGPTALYSAVGTWNSRTVYNPRTNQFLVAWVWGTSAPTLTSGRLVNADASIGGPVNLISNRWASSDGMDVDYNPVTDTYFLVSATNLSGSDGGVELVGSTGIPVDNGFLTTAAAGSSGDPHPRIKASSEAPNWLICYSASFLGADAQLVTGTPSGTPPPSQGPVSRPQLAVETPANNATLATTGFVVAGWAADTGASAGTGIDAVAVWALPSNGGAAILAGIASYGGSRPDVGAYLGGGSQFVSTGYGLTATLPAGSYTLAVYAHSTVNNSWNTPVVRTVTVTAPQSRPTMWVDTPGPNSTISSGPNVHIGGWAVDLGASSGSGIDAIHVWAYPQGSSTPVFVGAGTTGVSRPDIAALFGSQFGSAGFDVFGPLAPDNYTLVVFAHSSVTGTFVLSKTVSITAQ